VTQHNLIFNRWGLGERHPTALALAQEKFSQDIHAQKGLTCVDCHGGDPARDDPDKAMSRRAGWKGKIERKQIPQLCGTCHWDPAYSLTLLD
jgi:formate-dependent nitrite reductase cytochrome c552 subunit